MKQLSQLLPFVFHSSHLGGDADVASIEYDSRKVKPNSLFVARRGLNTDGHNFISNAIRQGASVIVCESIADNLIPLSIAVVTVPDSAIALAELSHAFYNFPTEHLRVIGVTGTNGKTTCTYIIKQLLESTNEKIGMIGTTGNFIGDDKIYSQHTTPEAPELCALFTQMIEAGCTSVVMEVSSHALALRRVHGVHFSVAIFTNLTQDHLDFHHSMDKYAQAKKMLFDSLDSSSLAIVNSDSAYAELLVADCKARVVRAGHEKTQEVQPDYIISNEALSFDSTSFALNNTTFQTQLVGLFNIENAALSIVCALELGVDINTVVSAIIKAHGAPGRMQRVILGSGAIGIVDYAHTPDALEKALKTCRELLIENRKLICVFGCGGERDTTKRTLMGSIAERFADVVIITNDNPRAENPGKIIHDILQGVSSKETMIVIPDRKRAIEYASDVSHNSDIILVAGKGHEEYQIIAKEKFYFSDLEELLRFV